MKIYTKKGDNGKTSIIGQSKLNKHDTRIEAYGTIDELNSYIGLIRSYNDIKFKAHISQLEYIQNSLFRIGALLATVSVKKDNSSLMILDYDIHKLESFIDDIEEWLPQLKSFILPGGHLWSSHVQVCRSICRRAERRITLLNEIHLLDVNIIKFINRLSDYLFVLSRYINIINNVDEIKWNN